MASRHAHKRNRLMRQASDEASRRAMYREGDDSGGFSPTPSSDATLEGEASKRMRVPTDAPQQPKGTAKRIRDAVRHNLKFGISVIDVFDALDADADGYISWPEWQAGIRRLGVSADEASLRRVFSTIDVTSSGRVSASAFARFIGPSTSAADTLPSSLKDSPDSLRRRRRGRGRKPRAGSFEDTRPSSSDASRGRGSAAASGAAPSPGASSGDSGPFSFHQAKVALTCAANLRRRGGLSSEQYALLKDFIARHDERVQAAVAVFDDDSDVEELLDTLVRVARLS